MSASPPPPCLSAVTDDYVWAENTSQAADILWIFLGLTIVVSAVYLLYAAEERTKFKFSPTALHWTAVAAEAILVGAYLAIWARALPCMFVSCHSGDDQVYSAVLFITTWPLVVVVLVIIHAVTKWTPLWVANGDHLKVVGGEDGPAPVESYLFRGYWQR